MNTTNKRSETPSSSGSPPRPIPSRDSHQEIFRLNSPGGRIGLPRLGAVHRLLLDVEGVELLISRRQSMIVKGTFDRTPSFLHEELSSDQVQGPNVKSYPVFCPDPWMDPVLGHLDDLQHSLNPALSFSVSPSTYLRGELRRDDVCLILDADGESVRFDSGAWAEPPRELLPPVPTVQLHRALDALHEVLPRCPGPLGEHSFASVRRSLLRSFNKSPRSENEPLPLEDCRFVHEDVFISGGKPLFGNTDFTVLRREGEDDVPWILIVLETGVLPSYLLEWIVSELSRLDINHLRLTPEQNLLIPLHDHAAGEVAPPSNESDPGWSSFSRITTCPGSHFCQLAHPPPVEMARRIHQSVIEHPELLDDWIQTPVGITGCGETERLERLRPIGITPDPEGGFRLYSGGTPHGQGRAGQLRQSGLDEEHLIKEIPELLTERHG